MRAVREDVVVFTFADVKGCDELSASFLFKLTDEKMGLNRSGRGSLMWLTSCGCVKDMYVFCTQSGGTAFGG
jgi:hypothetical protein